MPETYLEDLRRDSAMSIQQVLNSVREVAPGVCPKERSGIINWEQQGILDARVINALASVYDKPFELVLSAAESSKRRFQKRQENKFLKK